MTIRAKICDKEKESKIIDYIDDILGDTYSVKNEKYAKFGYLPANGIKGLCYFKVQKAEELGISVSINISKKIKNSTVFYLDLKQQREFAKILGVFIDNAIEASSESKDKELGIEAYSNLENEFRMIISNTYNNEIDEEKIGKEMMVIGPNGEQLGLKSKRDALTLAGAAGFDLVLMNENSNPAVCKIMDYNRFKYEKKKKAKEAMKKQREATVNIKE